MLPHNLDMFKKLWDSDPGRKTNPIQGIWWCRLFPGANGLENRLVQKGLTWPSPCVQIGLKKKG